MGMFLVMLARNLNPITVQINSLQNKVFQTKSAHNTNISIYKWRQSTCTKRRQLLDKKIFSKDKIAMSFGYCRIINLGHILEWHSEIKLE